jgi:predicted O-linked N-acetylglucosamine transferase (SPINDLY family)
MKYSEASVLASKKTRNYSDVLLGVEALINECPVKEIECGYWNELFAPDTPFELDEEHITYAKYAERILKLFCEYVQKSGQSDIYIYQFLSNLRFKITAHANTSVRSLMEQRANLIMQIGPENICREFDFNKKNSKPRFAILYQNLGLDPETESTIPFYKKLKLKGVEVFIFVLSAKETNQEYEKYYQTYVDKIEYLTGPLEENINSIRVKNIDLLLFGNDISASSKPAAYLSFYKIAKKTAICVSTIATTCSPYVNYYFGCKIHIENKFDNEFSEKFIAFPNPAFSFHYDPKFLETLNNNFQKQNFKLSESDTLYVSGANFTKISRQLVVTWIEILKRKKNSFLFLYPFPPHYNLAGAGKFINWINNIFKEEDLLDRFIILEPIIGKEKILDFLSQMDISLDSFPYPGVTTLIDSLIARLPIINLRGSNLRTSQGSTILESINLNELITSNYEEYIDLAVMLASDKLKHNEIKQKIMFEMNNNPLMLNSKKFDEEASDIIYKILISS